MTINVAAALRCRGCNEVHYLNDDQLCLDCSDKAQEATVPKPIYALPSAQRRQEAEKYAGVRCHVEVHPYRDNDGRHNKTITGLVIGVAIPTTGTVADQLIIRTGTRDWLQAISLAHVHSIEVV